MWQEEDMFGGKPCRSLTQVHVSLIFGLQGLMSALSKIVGVLFCFNMYLIIGNDGVTFLQFKRKMNTEKKLYLERVKIKQE